MHKVRISLFLFIIFLLNACGKVTEDTVSVSQDSIISAPPNIASGLETGTPAPDFTLPDPNNKAITLSSFRGKYVLVDFWASWCGPCREENPHMVEVYEKYKDKGLVIIGVSLDRSAKAWQQAIQKDGLTWLQVSDLKEWESETGNQYNVQQLPSNFLIDKKGVIIAVDLRGDDLDKELETIFSGK